MDLWILRISLFLVGIIFIGAGGLFVKDSMEAKDLIESTLFALFGVAIGVFLVIIAIFGPPG